LVKLDWETIPNCVINLNFLSLGLMTSTILKSLVGSQVKDGNNKCAKTFYLDCSCHVETSGLVWVNSCVVDFAGSTNVCLNFFRFFTSPNQPNFTASLIVLSF
jgi:hypothetical protein